MSRNYLLAAAAICWPAVGIYMLVHAVSGDMLIPFLGAATLAVWVGVRQTQRILGRQTAAVEVDSTA